MDFPRFGRVVGDFLRDDVVRDAFQVIEQRPIHFLELRHERFLDERSRNPSHDGVVPLTAVAVRFYAVSPEKRDEDLPRPGIVHREAIFFAVLLLCDAPEPGPDALTSTGCGLSLSRRGGSGIKSLDLAKRFEELVPIVHLQRISRHRHPGILIRSWPDSFASDHVLSGYRGACNLPPELIVELRELIDECHGAHRRAPRSDR